MEPREKYMKEGNVKRKWGKEDVCMGSQIRGKNENSVNDEKKKQKGNEGKI